MRNKILENSLYITYEPRENLSLVVSDQVKLKPACSATYIKPELKFGI